MLAPLYRLMTRLALALASASAAMAQLPPPGRTAITPQLIAESSAPAGGGRVTLAVVMRPLPGWHGYWKNPGDAGIPPRIAWSLPGGVTAGPLQYPVPKRLIIADLMNYVYEADYAHLVALDVPPMRAGTTIPLRAKMNWLACTDKICVPEEGELTLDLPVGDGVAAPAKRARFDGFRRALPRPLAAQGKFEIAGDRFRLAIPLPAGSALDEAYFFPGEGAPASYSAAQNFRQSGDWLVMETAAVGEQSRSRLDGVLAYAGGQGFAITALPGPVPKGVGADGLLVAVLLAFAGAVAGGLLLNVMPCVFPILSLKALSLARAGGSDREARREALAYTGGALLTCVALGAVLLALRASGETVGWAFQLQDPRVVFALLLLTFAIAMNLAGLFELPPIAAGGALAGQGGAIGSFWTGALAAFVATPCTGPFLGAALGATLVLPAAAAIAIFAGLGLGLALPFLALGYFPRLRSSIPKPGPWMNRLRRWLSVPMFLTAAALLWLLSRTLPGEGFPGGALAVVFTAAGLIIIGRDQAAGKSFRWVSAIVVAGIIAMTFVRFSTDLASSRVARELAANAFSEARLAALRAEGRPVFLYFTADWCVSCKVNEKIAIDRSEVVEAFAAARVAVMVGDWTNGDPAIGRFLESQGRSGVPLYLYYAPGAAPRVLPQLLTPAMLTGLVR